MTALSTRLRSLFDRAGARFLDVPVLHPADPFLETAGEDIRRRMFVTEGPQGERIALRPDFTIPVCLAHLNANGGPARYAYRGLVFRRHDRGSPERLETGYEDIGGEDRVTADAETLSLAIACATEAAPGKVSVRLGDITLFTDLLRALGLPGRWRRRLRRSFGLPQVMAANLKRMVEPRDAEDRRLDSELRKAAGSQGALVALLAERLSVHGFQRGAGRSPEDIAERFLYQRAIPDAAIAARAATVVGKYLKLEAGLADAARTLHDFAAVQKLDFGTAIAFFERRAAAISARASKAEISFEAGFGRPLDYYTGLVFDIRAAGLSEPLIGGGRYDRMLEMLGAKDSVPAVGFTMRLDQVEGGAE
jgi:ATP phosphoribosyltransferase regulatory subunit